MLYFDPQLHHLSTHAAYHVATHFAFKQRETDDAVTCLTPTALLAGWLFLASGSETLMEEDDFRFDVIEYTDLSPELSWIRLGSGAQPLSPTLHRTQGSFGRVSKAKYLGIDVAVKEVLPSDVYDDFDREVKILQEARHPNIVAYIGTCLAPPSLSLQEATPGAPSRRVLIITEYAAGGNLRAFLTANGSIPWGITISFAIDLARAIAYLHARNCVHRDLKGENAVLTDNGRLKLCDFGFARVVSGTSGDVRRMSFCGTDGYVAPEVLAGIEFGVKADIFSFGIMLAEMIIGLSATEGSFKARNAPQFGIDVEEIIINAQPGCPPTLLDLAVACCATEASARPDVVTVLHALQLIEQQMMTVEASATQGGVTHVGSTRFRAAMKSKAATPRRAPRVPSFGGEVSVYTRSPGPVVVHDATLAAMLHIPQARLGNGATPASVEIETSASHKLKHRISSESIPTIPSSWLRQAAELATPKLEDDVRSPQEEDWNPPTPEGSEILPYIIGSCPTIDTVGTRCQPVEHKSEQSLTMRLHRFSTVKPFWGRLRLRRSEGNEAACAVCQHALGVMHEHLRCDDCGLRAHVDCADVAVTVCSGEPTVLIERDRSKTFHLKLMTKLHLGRGS